LAGKSLSELYLALWASAFENAPAALEQAAKRLADKDAQRRFVGVVFLNLLGLPEARSHFAAALEDADLRVALLALNGCALGAADADGPELSNSVNLFERVEKLIGRVGEKDKTLEPIGWPRYQLTASRPDVAQHLLTHLGDLPPTRLIPHLPSMSSQHRRYAV